MTIPTILFDPRLGARGEAAAEAVAQLLSDGMPHDLAGIRDGHGDPCPSSAVWQALESMQDNPLLRARCLPSGRWQVAEPYRTWRVLPMLESEQRDWDRRQAETEEERRRRREEWCEPDYDNCPDRASSCWEPREED